MLEWVGSSFFCVKMLVLEIIEKVTFSITWIKFNSWIAQVRPLSLNIFPKVYRLCCYVALLKVLRCMNNSVSYRSFCARNISSFLLEQKNLYQFRCDGNKFCHQCVPPLCFSGIWMPSRRCAHTSCDTLQLQSSPTRMYESAGKCSRTWLKSFNRWG